MPFPEIGDLVVAALFTAVLAWASFCDVRSRTIPNWSVLIIAALFAPWALLHWGPSALSMLAAAAIALVVGVGLYALGMVGAGDAKLFAAVALFAGLGHLLVLVLATALAGGAIALVSLATRPRRALSMIALRGEGDFGRGVPYGVAISVGGVLVVWSVLLHLSAPAQITL
jgi:prepilin peptidase CpaA